MKVKTYKSSSVLSFSVTMPSGAYRRIRFTPYSHGGGIYTTKDEKEQEVLESLPEYGRRYILVDVQDDGDEDEAAMASQHTEPAGEAADTAAAEDNGEAEAEDEAAMASQHTEPAGEAAGTASAEGDGEAEAEDEAAMASQHTEPAGEAAGTAAAEGNGEAVSVADYAEAKEYLMEHFGYKASQLRSKKAIDEAAEQKGIVFNYA